MPLEVAALQAQGDYPTVDAIRLVRRPTPDGGPAARSSSAEHTHSEDEVRFFS